MARLNWTGGIHASLPTVGRSLHSTSRPHYSEPFALGLLAPSDFCGYDEGHGRSCSSGPQSVETAILHENGEFLANLRIQMPNLNQQLAIADYLDRETARLDALVAAKARVLGLLAEKRRALITRAVTRGVNPHVPTPGLRHPVARRDSGTLGRSQRSQARLVGSIIGLTLQSTWTRITDGRGSSCTCRNIDVQWGAINTEDRCSTT